MNLIIQHYFMKQHFLSYLIALLLPLTHRKKETELILSPDTDRVTAISNY